MCREGEARTEQDRCERQWWLAVQASSAQVPALARLRHCRAKPFRFLQAHPLTPRAYSEQRKSVTLITTAADSMRGGSGEKQIKVSAAVQTRVQAREPVFIDSTDEMNHYHSQEHLKLDHASTTATKSPSASSGVNRRLSGLGSGPADSGGSGNPGAGAVPLTHPIGNGGEGRF